MYHHHETAKRRTALVAASALCLSQALDYLTQRPQSAVSASAWNGYLVPAYGWTWLVVGVVCLTHLRSGRLVTPMSLLAGACAAWGMVWFLGGITDGASIQRAVKTALVYWSIAVIVGALTGLTPAKRGRRDAD